MKMQFKTYTYDTYWKERGLTPAEPFSEEKQKFILSHLFKLDFDSILEFGVGNGELSKLILQNFSAYFEGFDVSEARIYQFEENMNYHNISYSKYKVFQSDFRDYEPQLKEYDLTICSHFLLHIRPQHINEAIKLMLQHSKKYMVFFEPNSYYPGWPQRWEYYNFPYYYDKILADFGYKVEYFDFNKRTGLYLVKK